MAEEHRWELSSKFCPGTYFNATNDGESNCESDMRKLSFDFVPASAGLVSASASILGCALMLLAYYRFHDFRTGSRRVATFLALSNLFLATGSVVAFVNTLWYGIEQAPYTSGFDSSACMTYSVICMVQAFITWASALASFTWTTILAVYLYLVLVRKSILIANRTRVWGCYWLFSIIIPLAALTPILATGYLGYSPYANGGGCFIATAQNNTTNDHVVYEFSTTSTALIVTIKCIELVSYILVVGFFAAILCHLRKPLFQGLDEHESSTQPRLYSNLSKEWKLAIVPFSFVILRIWGTIAVFLSIGLYDSNKIKDGCVSSSVYGVLYALTVLQAIGDPGQGWANAILFIFLSPLVRQRLLRCCHSRIDSTKYFEKPASNESSSVDYQSYLDSVPTSPLARTSAMSSPVAISRKSSRRSSFIQSVDSSDYGVIFPHTASP